jgi:hypothetical protein
MGLTRRGRRVVGATIAVLAALALGSLIALVLTASTTKASPDARAPIVARVSRCLLSELSVKPGQGGAAAGSIGQVVHFTNVSHATCTLDGYPGLQMLGAAGKPIATEVHRGSSVTVQALPVRLVNLLPGRVASFNLGYSDGTGFGNEKCPTSTRVEITPPNDYSHFTIAWALQPYGGDIPHLECGLITVSPVFAGS